jgi:hypothetical protein
MSKALRRNDNDDTKNSVTTTEGYELFYHWLEFLPAVSTKDPLSFTPSYMFKTFLGLSIDASKEPPQDLLVISPGFGRTGTSSFITALSRIGLKSYHMSAVVRTPGHLKIWTDYIQGKTSADQVIYALSTAGYNATASMPACHLYHRNCSNGTQMLASS